MKSHLSASNFKRVPNLHWNLGNLILSRDKTCSLILPFNTKSYDPKSSLRSSNASTNINQSKDTFQTSSGCTAT